jgi:hypothetical protein
MRRFEDLLGRSRPLSEHVLNMALGPDAVGEAVKGPVEVSVSGGVVFLHPCKRAWLRLIGHAVHDCGARPSNDDVARSKSRLSRRLPFDHPRLTPSSDAFKPEEYRTLDEIVFDRVFWSIERMRRVRIRHASDSTHLPRSPRGIEMDKQSIDGGGRS